MPVHTLSLISLAQNILTTHCRYPRCGPQVHPGLRPLSKLGLDFTPHSELGTRPLLLHDSVGHAYRVGTKTMITTSCLRLRSGGSPIRAGPPEDPLRHDSRGGAPAGLVPTGHRDRTWAALQVSRCLWRLPRLRLLLCGGLLPVEFCFSASRTGLPSAFGHGIGVWGMRARDSGRDAAVVPSPA